MKDSTSKLLQNILLELQRSNGGIETTREILTLPEAADYLRQSESTLRDWVRLRKIPFSKVCGNIRFRKSKLDRWIDRNEVQSA